MSVKFLKRFLSDEDLKTISLEIAKVEAKTSGELRVCLKNKRGILQGKYTPRELAINEFLVAEMDATKDKTGVLIFILFGERKFEIVADEGINSKISDHRWHDIEVEMTEDFKKEKYLEGILAAVNAIGDVLVHEFPVSGDDDHNELSNDVILK